MTKKRRDRGRAVSAPQERGTDRSDGVDPVSSAGAGGPSEPVHVPRWLAPVLYAATTVFLFRAFVFSDQMLLGTDTLSLGYVARAFYAAAVRDLGTFPLWNPQLLGGTPFLESLAGGDSLYPTALLLFVMETHRALGWKLVLHVFAAGLFMHGWLRCLGVSRAAALLGGLAYLSAPFMVTLVYPGQDGKLFVTALTPLLFWVTERGFAKGGMASWSGVGLVVALALFTTHFQMAYFLFGATGTYAVFRAIQEGREGGGAVGGRQFAAFMLAAVLGAGGAAVQLFPAAAYVTEYSRRAQTTTQAEGAAGAAYSSSWSLHPEEVVSLVVPEFVGNSAGGAAWADATYWGRNVFKLNHEYAGLVVLLLAFLAFFAGTRRGIRWFLAVMGLVALLFALGAYSPVWWFFFTFVPGVSLFRAPSMVAWLFGFAAITLMAFGVDHGLALARREEAEWKRASSLLGAVAILLGVGVLLAATGILTDVWVSLVYPGIEDAKRQALEAAQPFITRGFLVAAVLSLATVGVLWWHRRGLGTATAVAILGVLLLADAARIDTAFIQTLDYYRWAAPDENMRYLQDRLEQGEPFRVLSMVGGGQDVKPALYGVELAAGHHPNDLGRYREVIGMVGSGAPQNLLGNPNVLAALNVRYILWPTARFGPIEGLGLEHLSGLRVVSQSALPDGRVLDQLYSYPGLPRARLVAEAQVVPDDEVLGVFLSPEFDVGRSVVLSDAPPAGLPGGGASGSVVWEERGPNALRLAVRSETPALLVLAENWFTPWHATVDGDPVELLRVNHTLRAVPVGPGESTVALTYASSSLRNSLFVTVLSLSLLIGALVVPRLRERRKG